MKKKDLATLAGVSIYTMNKLTSDGNVTMEVIEKICTALNCKVDDILEFIKEWKTSDSKDSGAYWRKLKQGLKKEEKPWHFVTGWN